MKKIPPIDVRNIREQLCDVLFRPSTLSPALRKKELIRLISLWENDGDLRGIPFNQHHCVVLRHDKDIRSLIKQNKLSIHREHPFHARHGVSYLRVVK